MMPQSSSCGRMNAGMNCTAWNSVDARALSESPSAVPSKASTTATTTTSHAESLDDRGEPEGEGIAHDEVRFGQWRGQQALEGSTRPLAKGGDRGHEEHDDEREDPEQGWPELVEIAGAAVEDPSEQPHQDGRHSQDQGHSPQVVAQLSQNAAGSGNGAAQGHVDGFSMRAMKADSKSVDPVRAKSASGESSARIWPSRMSRSLWQRSASSMTWLDTMSVVPDEARAANNTQMSRRSRGSRPTVGSSSTSSRGEPRRAVANETRACSPPERRPTTVSVCRPRPTSLMTRSAAVGGTPKTVAK